MGLSSCSSYSATYSASSNGLSEIANPILFANSSGNSDKIDNATSCASLKLFVLTSTGTPFARQSNSFGAQSSPYTSLTESREAMSLTSFALVSFSIAFRYASGAPARSLISPAIADAVTDSPLNALSMTNSPSTIGAKSMPSLFPNRLRAAVKMLRQSSSFPSGMLS